MDSSENPKGIIIADSVPGRDDFSTSGIVVFLTIYLSILKVVEAGFVLDISLVALLCLIPTRKRGIWVLQPPSNIYAFPGSKNLLTIPLGKPLIPRNFVFSRPIISRVVSDGRG